LIFSIVKLNLRWFHSNSKLLVVPGHFAAIDLGSNTFHLVIFKDSSKGANIVERLRIPVGIGKGGIEQDKITDEALQRGISALQEFKKEVSKYKCEKIIVTATSAFRSAKNSLEVIKKIKEQTGFDVRIISGDEEASLIYDGVKQGVELGSKTGLIMDIGGGSVEFIVCNSDKMLWKQSFEIGGIRLMEKFHQTDPISNSEIKSCKNYLLDKLSPLIEACEKFSPSHLIGASGSFDTIYEMREANLTTTGIPRVEVNEVIELKKLIETKNHSERLNVKGLIPMRAEMIVVAYILIDTVLESCKLQWIDCSSSSLKEGLIYRMLNQKTIF